jgi:CheY-like chemotaxis protein
MQRNVHIVLADDDPDDCFIFSSLSKEVSEKITITCLGDCLALLEYLETNKAPDIIFLDLNMPVLSGQDCLRKIKQQAEWKHIPIVIYSTASRTEIIDQCYKLGANLYIVKPNDTNRLKQLIDSTLKQLLNLNPVERDPGA